MNFGVQKRLRAFLNPFFTGGVVEENGICSAAFCESAALRERLYLVFTDPFREKCVWSAPQSATNALYQKKFPLYLPRAQAEGIFNIPPLPLDFKVCYTERKRCTQER